MAVNFLDKLLVDKDRECPGSWQFRKKALDQFMSFGLPNKYQENWKYIDFDQEVLNRSQLIQDNEMSLDEISSYLPEVAAVHQLWTYNQQIIELEDPAGYFHLHSTLQYEEPKDGLEALNQAFHSKPFELIIPDNTHVAEPIYVFHMVGSEQNGLMVHPQQRITVGEGSKVTIIEMYLGVNASPMFMNSQANLILKKQASLKHIVIQHAKKDTFMHKITVKQQMHSQYNHTTILQGGALNRSQLIVDLQEPYALASINSILKAKKNECTNHHVRISHLAPNCHSQTSARGIADRLGKTVFDGKIYVDKSADFTEAYLNNKNMHLSPDSLVYSSPLLEIYNQNVKCSHGATVGSFDEEQLFYLQSRGIDQSVAKTMLIEAFTRPIVDTIPKSLQNYTENLIYGI